MLAASISPSLRVCVLQLLRMPQIYEIPKPVTELLSYRYLLHGKSFRATPSTSSNDHPKLDLGPEQQSMHPNLEPI